jgi:hypothetical protein
MLTTKCPTCGREPPRTMEQNSAQWPILECWSKQRMWCINGKMQYISKEDYKDILSSAFEKENPRVANAYGSKGVVMLGKRTSKFNKQRFSEWIEWLKAVSIVEGIEIGEKS